MVAKETTAIMAISGDCQRTISVSHSIATLEPVEVEGSREKILNADADGAEEECARLSAIGAPCPERESGPRSQTRSRTHAARGHLAGIHPGPHRAPGVQLPLTLLHAAQATPLIFDNVSE